MTQPEASSFTKSLAISWSEIQEDAKHLAQRLKDSGQKWDKILAITRGGLVPAALLSRSLGIRFIDTICLMSYDEKDQQQDGIETIKPLQLEGPGDNILIVDDLVDTGKTASFVKEMLPKAHLAVLYAKTKGKPFADTYFKEISQDTWIYFPWELEPKNTP